MTAAALAACLEWVRPPSRPGGWYTARCPAHSDQNPSLRFKDGDRGIIFHCHAGCTIGAVREAVGRIVGNLSSDSGNSRTERQMVETYDYCDEAGELLYQVVRFEPKEFRQRRPDENGGWIWNLNGTRKVLYHLPELRGKTIVFKPEGEKDVNRLRELGLAATCNPGGARAWRDEYARQLQDVGVTLVIILPDNDAEGMAHAHAVARSCLKAGLEVKILTLLDLPPKGDVSEWLDQQPNQDREQLKMKLFGMAKMTRPVRLQDLPPEPTRGVGGNPWVAAESGADFLNSEEPDLESLEDKILARGLITKFFAPRGLGKTNLTYAIAKKLDAQGRRILLLDRDNSRGEVRRRLRAWFRGTEPQHLKVMSREKVPPLTDPAAWEKLPYRDYDLVIIDSLDATAEGIGEKDSAKPSKAIAPLLDLAHRQDGPAVLVLGNTVRTAEHSRGSGVIEDRADICYEIRDATGLRPSGTKHWWQELPPAGAGSWAERATRRKRRTTYRCAFVASKFRVGEEPEPFVLELHLPDDAAWSMRDVTRLVMQVGDDNRGQAETAEVQRLETAAMGLVKLIEERAKKNEVVLADKDAIPLLRDLGLGRNEAAQLLKDFDGHRWWVETLGDRPGRPKVLKVNEPPLGPPGAGDGDKTPVGEITYPIETPRAGRSCEGNISPSQAEGGWGKYPAQKPAPVAGFRDPTLFPPPQADGPGSPPARVPRMPVTMDAQEARRIARQPVTEDKQTRPKREPITDGPPSRPERQPVPEGQNEPDPLEEERRA